MCLKKGCTAVALRHPFPHRTPCLQISSLCPYVAPPALLRCAVGELPREQYQTLRDAGADRYLLRIESSNPELYASIHPPAQVGRGQHPVGALVGGLRRGSRSCGVLGAGPQTLPINCRSRRRSPGRRHPPARRSGRTACAACATSRTLGSWCGVFGRLGGDGGTNREHSTA